MTLHRPNLMQWVDVNAAFAFRWRRRRAAFLIRARTKSSPGGGRGAGGAFILKRLSDHSEGLFRLVVSFL